MKSLFPEPKYILALIIVNVFWLIFISTQFQKNYAKTEGILFAVEGETRGYFEPLESIIAGGGYTWFAATNRFGDYKVQPSTRRVPGIGVVYLPLRLFFGQSVAKDLLVLIQWTLHVLAWSLLMGAIVKYYQIESPMIIWSLVLLNSVSLFDKVFNNIGLAESLSNTALILSFSFIIFNFLYYNSRFLLLAGLFAAWSVFLRPATGVFWALGCLIIFFPSLSDKTFLAGVKSTTVFVMPLIIFLSLWSLRNYTTTGILVILEDDIYKSQASIYPPVRKSIRIICLKKGERYEHWIPGSLGELMLSNNSTKTVENFSWSEKSNIKLKQLRLLRVESELTTNRDRILEIDNESIDLKDEIINDLKTKRPFHYYLINPLTHVKDFVHKKFYSYLPFPPLDKMSLFHKAIKVGEAIYHYIVVTALIISLMLSRKRLVFDPVLFITIMFPLTYIILLPLLLGAAEPRYIVSVYPFLSLNLFLIIWNKHLKTSKNTFNFFSR